MPMETVHRPVTGMKRFMGKCPTLSPLPLNHGDSFTGRSTFIHVIPYTFICNRIPSNILQYTQFHGNQMPCPPIQVHPRLFPFHSYPFHGNFSIFPHLSFSLVFFPFSSLLRARDIEFHRINHLSREFIRAFVQPIISFLFFFLLILTFFITTNYLLPFIICVSFVFHLFPFFFYYCSFVQPINYSFSTMTHLSLSSFPLNDDALSFTNNLFYFHSNHILSL